MTDDDTPAPARALTLPEFAPVPREKDRSNGWRPEVQRAFIEALAETGSVKAACRRVGRADHGAYLLRRHPQAEEFRRAWDAALDIGMRRIEDVAMDRALHGHEQPVYSYGKLVGTRTVYNDRLLMFMLRNRAPERFGGALRENGAKGPNAIDRMERERLKKKWRKEWDREHCEESIKHDRDHGETFAGMIRARHVQWWARLGPRARAAYLEFRRIESEESRASLYGDEEWDEDSAAAAVADYRETWPDDGRAAVGKLIEADGLADEDILGQDLPPAPPGRMLKLTDDGWFEEAEPLPTDGRATPWP